MLERATNSSRVGFVVAHLNFSTLPGFVGSVPERYHRVRLFGWFHPASRQKLNRVRALSKQNPLLTQDEREKWQPSEEIFEPVQPAETKPVPPPECPHCQRPMVLVGSWRAGQSPLVLARAPP